MSKLVNTAQQQLKEALLRAAEEACKAGELSGEAPETVAVEVPADHAHGDYATNFALASAKAFHTAPRKIAEALVKHIGLGGTYFDRCEIAGPGFINFFLSDRFYADVMQDVAAQGAHYGESDYGQGKKLMVEFVSANPTGPMHIGNARGGALGDCLAAVFSAAGYDVTREFYVNDAGNQIEKFGLSLELRYLQIFKGEDAVEFPEDCYQGQDIRDRAAEFAAEYGDRYLEAESAERKKALVDYALPKNIEGLRQDLARYRIHYDVWFRESVLHEDGELRETIGILKDKGATFEKDGALWYKATEYGGEKDEVLIRSNGIPTYFAADIAYHRNKFLRRGFDRVVNVWGADHHGHVARLKGAMDAIGLDGSKLDIVLMQLVRLTRDGEIIKASKRSGKAITLNTLLDEVPVDAARFFFNIREPNSHLDFDLGLAVEQSAQNPVYYCQYAHARICSILKKMKEEGVAVRECTAEELEQLKAPEERELIRHLASLTGEIVSSAKAMDPSRITRYAVELATLFHKFYNACRVMGVEEPLMQARLNLCLCVKTVLANVLSMLKLSAPESM